LRKEHEIFKAEKLKHDLEKKKREEEEKRKLNKKLSGNKKKKIEKLAN